MPSKSLVHCGENRAANKIKKRRRENTAGTCVLPLAFIHKSKKPRCFKKMDMPNLPFHYFSQ